MKRNSIDGGRQEQNAGYGIAAFVFGILALLTIWSVIGGLLFGAIAVFCNWFQKSGKGKSWGSAGSIIGGITFLLIIAVGLFWGGLKTVGYWGQIAAERRVILEQKRVHREKAIADNIAWHAEEAARKQIRERKTKETAAKKEIRQRQKAKEDQRTQGAMAAKQKAEAKRKELEEARRAKEAEVARQDAEDGLAEALAAEEQRIRDEKRTAAWGRETQRKLLRAIVQDKAAIVRLMAWIANPGYDITYYRQWVRCGRCGGRGRIYRGRNSYPRRIQCPECKGKRGEYARRSRSRRRSTSVARRQLEILQRSLRDRETILRREGMN